MLFSLWSGGGGAGPMVLDLETRQWHRVRPGAAGGSRYVPTGHIISSDPFSSGSLFAAAFDDQELVADGTGLPVLDDVRFLGSESAYSFLAVSQNGTAVYVANEIGVGQLMWVDRKSTSHPMVRKPSTAMRLAASGPSTW